MEIRLKTLTPIWTGGVDGRSNLIRETGLIGSLRWWYEALVRGLGGYVGDPTSDNPSMRCEFDTDAYNSALKDGKPQPEALAEGWKTLGAVEYLFGATGWARLFRLRAERVPRTPLHFRTTVSVNKNWLGRIFGKEEDNYNIDRVSALYGDVQLHVSPRGYQVEYTQQQIAFLFRFIQDYGGLGARLQHGFGQIGELAFSEDVVEGTIEKGLQTLQQAIEGKGFRRSGPQASTPYSLSNFFHLTYELPHEKLSGFMRPEAHFGNERKVDETDYLPCAFDLRYKGEELLGLRRWLRDEKDWEESDDPNQLGPLDEIMGPRSQWELPNGRRVSIKDELRTASRVYFGMPVKSGEAYRQVVFGFAPPDTISAQDLRDLCKEYMRVAFNVQPAKEVLGQDLIDQAKGETE